VRDELVVAAEALLVERGTADAVTVAEVVARVGVTAPVLYRHFEDKDALFVAVHARRMDTFRDHLRRATRGVSSPRAALERRGRAYVRYALANKEAYTALFLTAGSMGPDVLGDPSTRTLTAFDDLVANVVACIESGEMSERDPELAARVIWSHVHGVASLLITMPSVADGVGRERFVDEALSMIDAWAAAG
jgi:AcrR family transcriptional regulator